MRTDVQQIRDVRHHSLFVTESRPEEFRSSHQVERGSATDLGSGHLQRGEVQEVHGLPGIAVANTNHSRKAQSAKR